ncbi:hypothetical protein N9B63_04590 [Akkermansiaceae bacterium]|nr:hypothetical protein [Akkermansiaceae bacterium]MDB4382977.1 hypothetical protein [Akkermansiaceae bacterium]
MLLLLFLLPLTTFAQHRATTVVQIHPARIGINGPSTPNYMADEHKTIVATDTIKIAAVKLYSGQKVDLKHAISDLRKRISTKGRRGTDLIEISADTKTKESAVKMSNAAADAFIKRRNSSGKSRAELQKISESFSLVLKTQAAKPKSKKRDAVDRSLHQESYFQAKEGYEQSRAMLREMQIKQQKARTLLKMPRSPVTIHESAK